MSDIEARLIEITENLHRNELTELERGEQIKEWMDLTEGSISCQVDTKRRGRPESGVGAASRMLSIKENDAHRAARVAALTDDAKEAARSTGFDDNQSALLEAAKAPREQQAAVVREIAEAGSVTAYRAAKIDGDIVDRSRARSGRQLMSAYKSGER